MFLVCSADFLLKYLSLTQTGITLMTSSGSLFYDFRKLNQATVDLFQLFSWAQ